MKKIISFILIGFGIGIILMAYAFMIEPNRLEIVRYKIKEPNLSGLKIIFATDFHLAPQETNRLKKIIKKINDEQPDIIILGGDYVKGHKKSTAMNAETIAMSLSELQSQSGIFAVLGNHDIWYGKQEIKAEFEKNNIRVLENENIVLQYNQNPVTLVGLADPVVDKPDLEKAFEKATEPVILIMHSPDLFADTPKTLLTLAGHTHGGQVALPFWGALIVPSKFGRRYSQGLIIENNRTMIVSKGLGTSILPIRLNCLPEIVVIDFIE